MLGGADILDLENWKSRIHVVNVGARHNRFWKEAVYESITGIDRWYNSSKNP